MNKTQDFVKVILQPFSNCLEPRSGSVSGKIPARLPSCAPAPAARGPAQTRRGCWSLLRKSALQLLLFRQKQGVCLPRNTWSTRHPSRGIRHMSGAQGQALLWKCTVLVCVSSPRALGVLGGGTGVHQEEILPRYGKQHKRPAGSAVSVLCFGLSHLEAAREPARVNIPSEYFKLQSSLVIITHR